MHEDTANSWGEIMRDYEARSCCLVQPLSREEGGGNKTISKTPANKPDSLQRWLTDGMEKQQPGMLLGGGDGGE